MSYLILARKYRPTTIKIIESFVTYLTNDGTFVINNHHPYKIPYLVGPRSAWVWVSCFIGLS